MLVRSLLNHILRDEALTRHLGDAEARVLIEWLVERAEHLGATLPADDARRGVERLCRRGRAVARFVRLWCHEGQRGAATQLAAAEQMDWPLPPGPIDPCRLMQRIVAWEVNAA